MRNARMRFSRFELRGRLKTEKPFQTALFNAIDPAGHKAQLSKRYIDGQIQKGGEVNFTIFKHFQFGVFPW